jgi:hypothetical protein
MRVFRTKTFSFSIIRGPIDVPPAVAADYSPEQASSFREQFKPLAANYRRRLRIMRWSIAGWIALCVALAFLLLASVTVFCAFGGFAGFLLLGVILWPALPPCPACRHRLDDIVATYCPECGSVEVMPGGFLQPPKCNACGKYLGTGRGGRQYKIRACTHCGVMLDEKGL